jgi:hypothetical protein
MISPHTAKMTTSRMIARTYHFARPNEKEWHAIHRVQLDVRPFAGVLLMSGELEASFPPGLRGISRSGNACFYPVHLGYPCQFQTWMHRICRI